ncbi:MAG: hypothetical protein IJ047_02765 [Paludibacteraceae bacterium]|nr:hypothetical protein [Paludibacteraceae bacterium]
MLEDYRFSEDMAYTSHRLMIRGKDIEIGGVLGAALVSALLVDTDEGNRRGIAIDSEAEQIAWIKKYEREVRREEWGLLTVETRLLSEAYISVATEEMSFADICPNRLLLDLALRLTDRYMRYLVTETFCAHIWECCPWQAPFASWLLAAARVETRRQRFIQMDWTDPALVTALADETNNQSPMTNDQSSPTLVFEGEAAEDIMFRYLKWVWTSYQAQLREIPGSQPRAPKHRNFIVEQETDWGFVMDEVNALNEDSQRIFAQWMLNWQRFVTRHLKPQKPVRFWTEETSELQQRQLTQYLRLQEKEWDYYKCLSAAIYAMRQMGYVRRACSVPDITRWMSEELSKDYTTKNNRDQFRRAWNELSRYHEDVRYFVQELQYLLEA